jgi:hypothetical protein
MILSTGSDLDAALANYLEALKVVGRRDDEVVLASA